MQARFCSHIADIGRDAWEALRPDDHPFLAYDFLHGLELSGSISSRLGWMPHHLLLADDHGPRAVAPCYLKANSHGEFVFDHAWAEAYQRHGLAYYPKLLCAAPYSPVTGPRVLCGPRPSADCEAAALQALAAQIERLGLSSAHVNFHPAELRTPPDWIERHDIQFHWQHRGWKDFDDFLSALTAKKRKNIRQERAAVARSGLQLRRCHGSAITEPDMLAMYGFYLQTFDAKGNYPALTEAFFLHLLRNMPNQLMLTLAERDGVAVAGALFLFSRDTLYGRYWGCSEEHPGLHFELCYYQGIEFCLERGLRCFEPGAQGEHKLARGFSPRRTCSMHFIADPRFRSAIAEAVRAEGLWRNQYEVELRAHSPYRSDACDAG